MQSHREGEDGPNRTKSASNASPASSVAAALAPFQSLNKMAVAQIGRAEQTQELQKPGKRKLNTENLGVRLRNDIFAATGAALTISPIITMIDRSIIENASGTSTLITSLRNSAVSLLTRPHIFLASRPFLLVLGLYTGTYAAANASDTLSSTLRDKPATTTSSGAGKFAATAAANLSLCVYKDSQFTRLFGAGAVRPVPAPTLALFAARDTLTIFASFCLPAYVAPLLPLSERFEKRFMTSASFAQFVTPAACQIVSTPLHLLGLDMYNRTEAGWAARTRVVLRDWAPSFAARVARIVPAFGVGGVVNMRVRRSLMEGAEEDA